MRPQKNFDHDFHRTILYLEIKVRGGGAESVLLQNTFARYRSVVFKMINTQEILSSSLFSVATDPRSLHTQLPFLKQNENKTAPPSLFFDLELKAVIS